MAFTNAFKKSVLDHVYQATTLTPTTTLYIGLATTANTPSSAGTDFTEPASTNGYARVAFNNNTTNWVAATAANPSVKTNAIEITFPESSGDWGTITHWGIFTHATSSAYIDYAALTVSKAISAGDTPKFSTGELKTQLQDT